MSRMKARGVGPKPFSAAACLLLLALAACAGAGARRVDDGGAVVMPGARAAQVKADPYAGKVAYVIVALCDNVNQGIVPVPAALGNGDDPARNLYWGARFGVKTHFNASREWRAVSSVRNPSPQVLERRPPRLDRQRVAFEKDDPLHKLSEPVGRRRRQKSTGRGAPILTPPAGGHT